MTTSPLTQARAESRPRAVISGIKEFTAWVLVLTLLGGAIILTVRRKVAFVRVGLAISVLERRESELLDQRRELEIEKAMLSSPERIERAAGELLHLGEPQPGQIRVIR